MPANRFNGVLSGASAIGVYTINPNGTLNQLGDIQGLPKSAGFNGIAALRYPELLNPRSRLCCAGYSQQRALIEGGLDRTAEVVMHGAFCDDKHEGKHRKNQLQHLRTALLGRDRLNSPL